MSKWTKKLMPQQVWNYYYPDTVDKFISDMEVGGITDITAMCKRFAQDIPWLEKRPINQEDIDQIAKLLEQHIRQHIEKIGGRDKLTKYTKEELEQEWQHEVQITLDMMCKAGILPRKLRK